MYTRASTRESKKRYKTSNSTIRREPWPPPILDTIHYRTRFLSPTNKESNCIYITNAAELAPSMLAKNWLCTCTFPLPLLRAITSRTGQDPGYETHHLLADSASHSQAIVSKTLSNSRSTESIVVATDSVATELRHIKCA